VKLTSANPLGCEKGIVRGCGWQKLGAFVNVGSYYLVDLPFAIVLAFVLHIKGEVIRFSQSGIIFFVNFFFFNL